MEEELLSFINLILSSPLGRTSTSSYITVTWTINTLVGSDTVIHLTTMGVDYNLSLDLPGTIFICQCPTLYTKIADSVGLARKEAYMPTPMPMI